MSIITRSIASADREARYLNPTELRAIEHFFEGGRDRLQIALVLSANEAQIIERGSQKFWQYCPITPSNSGNSVYRASCLRDQAWYLRLITYAVVMEDVEPIERIGILGAKEMYNSLGVPLRNVVECMRCLKAAALDLLSLDNAELVAPYFDRLIHGLMP